MRVFAIAWGLSSLMLAGPALAAWQYQANEDPFTDEVLHMAVGVDLPYSVGLRCTADDDLELLYFTPENADAETVNTLNPLEPVLMVRIDSAEVVRIPVFIEATSSGIFSVVTGHDLVYEVVPAISGATRRIAFAIEVLGQRMHAHEFKAAGSTKALNTLLEACNLL